MQRVLDTNERLHNCDICGAQFTRSDLLSRHKKGCNNQSSPLRRKSCVACTESKIKCDRELPCSKCTNRKKECIYAPVNRRTPRAQRSAVAVGNRSSQAKKSASIDSPQPLGPISSSDSSLAGAIDDLSVASSRDYSSVASTETSFQIPVSSHLASLYNHDMFEPFFTNIFSAAEEPLGHFKESSSEETPYQQSTSPEDNMWLYYNHGRSDAYASQSKFSTGDIPVFVPPAKASVSNQRVAPLLSVPKFSLDEKDRRHYLQLFYNGYVEQVPVVHAPSFSPENKPAFLINALQACGAIYVKTRSASSFMLETLRKSREVLAEELSKDRLSIEDQLYIVVTVVLLHTLGMFHEIPEERAASISYHGILISMIRRSEFISNTSNWSWENYTHLSLDERWRQWALHEMAKRALLLSYLQDTSLCIYFTVPSTYKSSEFSHFELPCDNRLWHACTAAEWWEELHRESPYGSPRERLACPTLTSIWNVVYVPRTPKSIPISPFGHWGKLLAFDSVEATDFFLLSVSAVIHGIIGRLFVLCTEGCVNAENTYGMEQELYSIQFALHNWLSLWMNRPEVLDNTQKEVEPPFMQNPLPFYWLGQVALMAYQERLPPFESDGQVYPSTSAKMNIRFFQVKKWLRLIRGFLSTNANNTPTLVWDELMDIRLRSWQVDLERPANDDPNGLLGFFVPQ
ncbi:hypothetical protein D9757_005644 [Collybiopsis confluens]|uniref:Zn(2)-C6 fungal-type domain-containing protein n=1 Tax=Collybiopsis confluens TaxID=2823264 RepID=A0A8H5HST3_9AGAR|nr:hypothetical protein D9757_005644 [Collybiopsis confluens]